MEPGTVLSALSRHRLVLITLALGGLLSLALFQSARQYEANRVLIDLTREADKRSLAIQHEAGMLVDLLNGVAGLYAASQYVDAEEFEAYYQRAVLHRAPIQTLMWIPRVPRQEHNVFVARARKDGYQDFTIQDGIDDTEHYPLYHIVSAQDHSGLRGLDLRSVQPYQRHLSDIGAQGSVVALYRAAEAPDDTIPDVIDLVLPLYRNGLPYASVAQRRHNLVGFLRMEIHIGILVEQALRAHATSAGGLDIYLFDHSPGRARQLLYFHPSRARQAAIDPLSLEAITRIPHVSSTLSLAGRPWELRLVPIPGRHSAAAAAMPWLVLGGGLLVSALLAAFMRDLQNRRWKVERLAAQRASLLLESREHIQTVLDTVVDCVIGIDQNGLIREFNPSAERIFDYQRAEVMGKNVNMLMPEPFHSEHDGYLHSYLHSGVRKIIGIGREVQGRRKDGSVFPMDLSVGEMKLEGASLFTGIVRDISDRKQAERRLQESQERFDLAVRGTNDGLWDWNVVTNEMWYAPRFKTLLGYAEDADISGFSFFEECLHPEDHDMAMAAAERHLADHSPYDVEYRLRCTDGNYRWFRARGESISDARGIPIRMAGTIMDITERKQSADDLMRANAQRQAILDGANYSIISTDTSGLIQTFSAGAEQLLGYTSAEMVGKHTLEFIHDDQEVVLATQRLSRELKIPVEPGFEVFVSRSRQGIPDEQEWTYIDKQGRHIPVSLSVTALRDNENNVIGFLGIASDISERKKIERMKDEFISTVSHELRTPLTSIRGSLGLLKGGAIEELSEQTSYLVNIAYNNCERLLLLINDILDMSKIESGKMKFNFQALNVDQFLQQAAADNQAYGSQHQVRYEVIKPLPGVKIFGDQDRLMQVMSNLLSNAAKFSHQDGVVELGAVQRGTTVRISVTDRGCGIPKEFQSKIFDRFSQADGSSTRKVGGTGLGLNISKAIVESHGGYIGFVTKIDMGTTFYFDLPEWVESDQETWLGPEHAAPMNRILVCEDDTDVALLLRLMLVQAGFDCDIARDADEAQQLLLTNHYAAMTLDIMLPGKDGIAFYRELREDPATAELPIVVVSAKANEARDEINGGSVSIADWIGKPIDQARLLSAVHCATASASGMEKPRILHVEDDKDVFDVVRRLLLNHAELVQAASLDDAERALREQHFDLVLLDIGLPDGSGVELLGTIQSMNPHLPVVVFSAQELDHDATAMISRILVKSRTSNEQLLDTIVSLLPPELGPGQNRASAQTRG